MFKKITVICFLAFAGLKGIAQTYCSPSYPNGCVVSNNRITNVQIGTINHSPPGCTVHDYTSLSTQVGAGVPIPLTVISEGWCGVGAAVDLNSDGDFDDPNEIQALPSYIGSQVATYNMNITIPTSTTPGAHRLRVYNRTGNSGNGVPLNSPCGNYGTFGGYGSWDDYILLVNLNFNLNLGQDTTICEGNLFTLSANPGFNYIWSTGDTTETINVTASGTYYVTMFAGSNTMSDTIEITVNPLPQVNLGSDISINTGVSTTLSAANVGVTYLWNTGAVTPSINVNSPGTYFVTVTDSIGCKASDTIIVSLKTVGFDELYKTTDIITVSPNPSKYIIHIKALSGNGISRIEIYNLLGQLVMSEKIENKSIVDFKVTQLPDGIYNLTIYSNNSKTIKKIQVMK